MRMRSIVAFVALGLLAVAAGCAVAPRRTAPVEPTPVQTSEKVAYVVPKDPAILIEGKAYTDSYRGISLAGPPSKSEYDPRGSGSSFNIDSYAVFHEDRNVVELFREKTYQVGTAKWKAYNKYYVDFTVTERPDGFVLTLIPKSHEVRGDRSLTVNLPPPVFEETTLLDSLASGYVRVKFEVDSTYDKDSVYANFKRRLGGVDRKESGDARKGTFRSLNTASVSAEDIVVEVWPYKGGSKTVVTMKVKMHPTSTEAGVRTIDVKRFVEDGKREIENIVKG